LRANRFHCQLLRRYDRSLWLGGWKFLSGSDCDGVELNYFHHFGVVVAFIMEMTVL